MKLEVQLCSLLNSIEKALKGEEESQALEDLNSGIRNLRTLFSRNPSMAITGELFEITEGLNNCALRLARHFESQGESELEEQAWKARYESLATAHAYRRNLLGPALIDWADCNLKLGNTDKADEIYHRIVENFTEILGWGPTFDPGWMVAVGCLEQALERSSRNYGPLEARTKELLRQSRKLAQDREARSS